MKAQVSVEYIAVVAMVLVILIPILYISLDESSSNIRFYQADDAVRTLARAADTVYNLGAGTKKYVWVNLPGGIESTSVGNNTIIVTLSIFGKSSNFYGDTIANLTGYMPSSKGTYKIPVEMLENGFVKIGS